VSALSRIIVGLELSPTGADLEPASSDALARAVELGRANGAALHLLHATHDDEHYVATGDDVYQQRDGLSAAGSDRLEQVTADLVRAGLDATLEISAEPAWRAIGETAKRLAADLVVVGKRNVGDFDFDDRPLGAVAFKLHRSCPTAVWSIDPKRPGPIEKVLVAVDPGDPSTARLLATAHTLAARLGARLFVIHAGVLAWPRAALENDATRSRRLTETQRRLEQQVREALPTSAEYTLRVVAQRPATAIVEEARRIDADVVVLGRRAHSALGEALVGHTAERVFGMLDRSILAVPPVAG
jgi:nucleotide-binding universal stress UspA family protein